MAIMAIVSKFNLHQQIRILLRQLRNGKDKDESLLDKKFFISSSLSLDAPMGDVESLEQLDPASPFTLTAWHRGLTGAMGALPTVYTEWLIERHYRYGDKAAKAFIDIFGHRLYCLDHLAWQKQHLYTLVESLDPEATSIHPLDGLLNSILPDSRMHNGPLMASSIHSMVGLELLISKRFGVPALVTPFTGGWCEVDKTECCQLGGQLSLLANAPMLGRSRFDMTSHFDVILGPMTVEKSFHFLPGCNNETSKDIWIFIRKYVGFVMDFSISLTICSMAPYQRFLGKSMLGRDLCLGSHHYPYQYHVKVPVPTYKQEAIYADH